MSPRALGCAAIGLGLFAAVLIAGVLVNLDAMRQEAGCPERLRWEDHAYAAVGEPAPEPRPGGEADGEPVRMGATLVGLTARGLYGPPGTPEQPDPADRPDRVALDCGDGTFQGYRRTP